MHSVNDVTGSGQEFRFELNRHCVPGGLQSDQGAKCHRTRRSVGVESRTAGRALKARRSVPGSVEPRGRPPPGADRHPSRRAGGRALRAAASRKGADLTSSNYTGDKGFCQKWKLLYEKIKIQRSVTPLGKSQSQDFRVQSEGADPVLWTLIKESVTAFTNFFFWLSPLSLLSPSFLAGRAGDADFREEVSRQREEMSSLPHARAEPQPSTGRRGGCGPWK